MLRLFLLTQLLLLAVPSASGATESVQIGVAWVGKAGMADRVANGLERSLAILAPDIDVEWQRELPDLEELDRVVTRFQDEKDAMVLLRSSGARYLGKNPPAIPTFIGGCNHPVQLGAMKNMQSPEGNVTGVTYALPFEIQFETFRAIVPKIESALLLLEKGHPGSEVDRSGTQKVALDLGVTYHEVVASSVEELLAAIETRPNVDLIIIGSQALNIDNTTEIVARAGKTPVMSYSCKPVSDGAIAGLAPDDKKLGRMLGESIVEVLIVGVPIKDVPVKVDPEPQLLVNMEQAQALGLVIPLSVLRIAQTVQ